ncbi:hypothetical protein ABZS78_29800, partial [Streptomyces decoyicus]
MPMTHRTTHPVTAGTTTAAGSPVRAVRAGPGVRTAPALSAVAAVLFALAAPAPAATASPVHHIPLPALMADTGGGDQLITARAPTTRATTGTVRWWQRYNGRWR